MADIITRKAYLTCRHCYMWVRRYAICAGRIQEEAATRGKKPYMYGSLTPVRLAPHSESFLPSEPEHFFAMAVELKLYALGFGVSSHSLIRCRSHPMTSPPHQWPWLLGVPNTPKVPATKPPNRSKTARKTVPRKKANRRRPPACLRSRQQIR